MSITAKVLIALGLAALIFGAGGCMYYVGVRNTCVDKERKIEAQYRENQSNLANYTNKVMEMVQVPKMAKDQIAEVAKAAIQGRYGEKGSQALFQAIAEQNPTIDKALYTNIQQAMESGRDSFHADQKMMADKCGLYEAYVDPDTFPSGYIASSNGFPRIDLKKLCDPVITEGTAKAFETKRAEAIQIQ